MADSIQDWQWLILAVIGVVGGLGSYIVNAIFQRSLERNKIQYEAKNRAFRDLTEAGRRLMSTIEAFRALAKGLNDPRMEPVETVMTGAVIAQDLERPLGSSLSLNILTRLGQSFEMTTNHKQTTSHKNETYKTEIVGAASSLHLLYTVLFTYYHEKLVTSSESAYIVMEEYDEFENAVAKFADCVQKSFSEQREGFATFQKNMVNGVEPTTSANYEIDENLRKMWGSLLDEMNENLYQTL
jgi:hypothetical protein